MDTIYIIMISNKKNRFNFILFFKAHFLPFYDRGLIFAECSDVLPALPAGSEGVRVRASGGDRGGGVRGGPQERLLQLPCWLAHHYTAHYWCLV